MSEGTFRVVELAVRIVIAVAAVYILPVIRKAIQQYITDKRILKAVFSAQEKLWKESGDKRRELAMKIAREALDGLHISISDDQLTSLMDAAVQEMRIKQGDSGKEGEK